MYCKNCGFINKGIEIKCPYCGTEFEPLKTLDKKINVFNWFYITVRQLIVLIGVNLFFILVALDIILFATLNMNLALLPMGFLIIFGLILLLNNFILKSNSSNKLLFLKTMSVAITFSILFWFSYSDKDLQWMNLTRSQFLLGFYYPILVAIMSILGFINQLRRKEINVFSGFFYILFLLTISSLNFGLSFIPQLGINSLQSSQLCVYASFAFTVFVTFNATMFWIIRMRSKVYYEDKK